MKTIELMNLPEYDTMTEVKSHRDLSGTKKSIPHGCPIGTKYKNGYGLFVVKRGMGFKIAGKNSLTLGVLINTPKRGEWGFITVLRGNGVPVISGGLFKIGARLRTDKWGRVVEAKKEGILFVLLP